MRSAGGLVTPAAARIESRWAAGLALGAAAGWPTAQRDQPGSAQPHARERRTLQPSHALFCSGRATAVLATAVRTAAFLRSRTAPKAWASSNPRTLRAERITYYIIVVEVHDSARKHGVADPDIHHAIDHALAIEDAGDDPDRWLVIGPDRAGNLLEIVVLITVENTQLAIHAMAMRTTYRRLLEP